MKSDKKNNFFIFSAAALLIQLVILYYIKYSNQQLSLSEFSITHTGNLLNLIFTLLLITGISVLALKNKSGFKRSLIATVIVIQFILLLLSFILTKTDLPFGGSYILSQPADKILIGFSFTAYQYSILVSLSIVWSLILKKGKKNIVTSSLINGLILFAGLLLLAFIFINTKYKKERHFGFLWKPLYLDPVSTGKNENNI